ncbi:MAG: deoxyguanosinetriphosphate triphosphohydrolase [Oscillospiraceae bacterium]|nr:deoxyguanosinetriphosphate triphosphohydrolase [Oscillospiraceae bacterium]
MNIRERIIEHENSMLSEYACKSGDAEGMESCACRVKNDSPCEIRTDFQRDRDRIIHSSAFRRLKDKTQVFLLPGGNYRTRLTHTLEVAQIARTIAKALRLNEDLTEAIALGHDLGHTPFGHDGERALDKLYSFKHSEQSVRVVEVIERDGRGLNLTKQVIDGILTHSSSSKSMTCEGDVVRLSDKIAYINHDIEDAISGKVLTNDELPLNAIGILGRNKSERITTLVMSIINSFEENGGVVQYDDKVKAAHDELRAFMFRRVYNNPTINTEKEKSVYVIGFLYEYFLTNLDKMPEIYQKLVAEFGKERAVCDCISAMTDNYAVELFIDLCVPKAWGE